MSFLKTLVRRVRGKSPDSEYGKIYQGRSFLDGYIEHTNQRVAIDPQDAIGGMWEEIGSLQLEFLKNMGLSPRDTLLDIGCGTLRGGRHFIRFLDSGNYTGIDISPKCLEAAHKLVRSENLEGKNPSLILNTSKNMKFKELDTKLFDFILAQSVFTHLPAEIIVECIENIGKVMSEDSAFYFTFKESKTARKIGRKGFVYPWEFFENLSRQNGFDIQDLSHKYPHPRGQKMACIKKSRG